MKLGKIKAEALYMCLANPDISGGFDTDEEITEALYQLKSDPNLSDYLNASIGAINRCFSFLEMKELSPVRTAKVTASASNDGASRLALNALIPDFLKIKSIFAIKGDSIAPLKDFIEISGGELLLKDTADRYSVSYYSKIPRISAATPESYDIMLDDCVCQLIPYFVKGDILRVDDADEAEASMSFFKEAISSVDLSYGGAYIKVDTVYEMR